MHSWISWVKYGHVIKKDIPVVILAKRAPIDGDAIYKTYSSLELCSRIIDWTI